MYAKIPFGLMNVGATFQREIEITFSEEKEKFVVSKTDQDHLQHLKRVFLNCRRFGISLNPKKSNFSMEEGKLLGHIISKKGIRIDLDRVAAIQKIGMPRNKKEI